MTKLAWWQPLVFNAEAVIGVEIIGCSLKLQHMISTSFYENCFHEISEINGSHHFVMHVYGPMNMKQYTLFQTSL